MMRTHKDAQPPELLEIAELRGEDRLDIAIKLAGLVGARRTYRRLLTWFMEHEDPGGRPIAFDAAKIGEYYLGVGKRCVQYGGWFWRDLGMLKFTERRDHRGSLQFPLVQLQWHAILARLGVDYPGAVPEVPGAGAVGGTARPGCDLQAAPFSPVHPSGGPSEPFATPSEQKHPENGGPSERFARVAPSDGGPSERRYVHGAPAGSMDRALACAHGLLSSYSTVVVVDSSGQKIEATWERIETVAREAAASVLPATPWDRMSHESRRPFWAAAILATLFFGSEWIGRANAAIRLARQEGRSRRPLGLWFSMLREEVFKWCRIGGGAGDITPGWFGAVMAPAERAAQVHAPLPPPPAIPPERPAAPGPAENSPEDVAKVLAITAECRRIMAEGRAAMRAKPR